MKKLLVLIIILFVTVGCSNVHEYPDGSNPWDPTVTVNINVTLKSSPISNIYQTVHSTRTSVTNLRRHFIVEAWENENEGKPVIASRTELYKEINDDTNLKLALKLNARKYKIAIWQDLVDLDGHNKFYTTASLEDIHLQEPASYIGDTDEKDCSSTVITVDLTPYNNRKNTEISVSSMMERPLTKLEFISTDAGRFIADYDIGKMSAKIVYSCTLPTGYDALRGKLTNTRAGYCCKTSLKAISDNEIRVGFDYILVDTYETYIYAMIYVYDGNGDEVCHAGPYYTPIKRGYVTEIRERFLK